jgi:hypothetical protein
MKEKDSVLIEKRIQVLNEFYKSLKLLFQGSLNDEQYAKHRSFINRNLIAVHHAVKEAGTVRLLNIAPPPFLGGLVMQNIDPFGNLFGDIYGTSLIPDALECVEQAIGVYEHIQSQSGLIELNPKEAIHIESAIERALRPSFRDTQPKSEKEVQDAIENILNALGVEFTRERDTTSVGGKYYKPDFVVESLDLAIEIKLAKVGNGAAKIQEDLNADISGYRTKWKNLLFIIYDLGVITDPYKFQTDNIKLFGVSVRVIKQ